MDTVNLAPLATFRIATYAAFGRRRDALFELCDTLLTTGPVPSLPFLSVQPQHQRRWGSLYDALAVGEMSVTSLERLLADYPLANGEPIFAVDTSVWPRCDAETSPERALYYHPRAIRRDNLSSRAGPIRGSPRLASHARAGRRPCACGGYVPTRTAT
jgi:DDE superfamily endonuclease